jgi:hypothetical protein
MVHFLSFIYGCRNRWGFYSSINATGKRQDAKFLLKLQHSVIRVCFCCIHPVILNMNYCIACIKKVVADVEENNIVQIITDNGSNYKKACCYLTNEYLHIAW